MANFNVNYTQPNSNSTTTFTRVGYFNLKNDGDEALVRFNYSSPEELVKTTVHTFFNKSNGRYTSVSCLRGQNDSIDSCPLCKSGDRVQLRTYLQLLVYTRDNTTGAITYTPMIWNKPGTFANTVAAKMEEYGDLKNCIFKIRRHGQDAKSATYDLIRVNPNVYNDETYIKDFSAFINFDITRHSYYEKSYDDLVTYVETGTLPMATKQTTQQQANVQPQAHQVQTQPQQYAQPTPRTGRTYDWSE